MKETIICYDITCPRRLARIHRLLKKQALPLQYSVFLFTGTALQLDRCLAQLERLMDKRHDDIRAAHRNYGDAFGNNSTIAGAFDLGTLSNSTNYAPTAITDPTSRIAPSA